MTSLNIAFIFDCTLLVLCFHVALLTARLAGAPGWREYRWFAAVAATGGLYIFHEGLTSFDWGDPASRAWKSRIGLCWALLHAGLWLEYSRRELQLPGSRVDRIARWALATALAATLLTPLVYRPLLDAPIPVRWLNATYIHNTGGPLAGPVFMLALAVIGLAGFRFFRAGRAGNRDAARTGAALILLVLLGLGDAGAALGLWNAPLLVGLGFVASVATHEMGQARRLAGLAISLQESSAHLAREVEERARVNASLDARVGERTKELADANRRLQHEMVERQKIELELRLAQKLESLGRLAAGVAHEINTPIQFASDSIHFIKNAMDDVVPLVEAYKTLEAATAAGNATSQMARVLAAQRENADLDYVLKNIPRALKRTLDGLDRVAIIVRSMKEFAHPDQKEMASVDLNRAIESTLIVARSEYDLVAEVEKKLGDIPLLTCYAGEVNQVLLTILVNAAHAIEEVVRGTGQKGLIRIETALDGDAVMISISDTGAGIPAGIQERIFDPFFTTKDVGKGTGQGLAIARATVVGKHGGRLTFETCAGKGTTFFVRLPIAPKHSAAIAG